MEVRSRKGQKDGGSDDRVTMTGMVIVCYCGVNPWIKGIPGNKGQVRTIQA